jgi:cysteine desulfurase
MLPFFSVRFGNPSNEIHSMGREARQAVDRARYQVAQLIGAQPEEIIFTSSATESNNLAILGLARSGKSHGRSKVVHSSIEHKSVLEACHALTSEGFEASSVSVDMAGHVDADGYRSALNGQVLLVSIQAANNEIGTIQRISALSERAHEHGAVFHCDGAQAVGKIPINVDTLDVDLLSVSAHKMYGPKGIAALYIRGGASRTGFKPLQYGGNQEWGLRPGTLNVPLIVGFGEACRIAAEVMTVESARTASLRDRLESALLAALPSLKRNGDLTNRLPNNSSLTFPGLDAESLIMSMPELALSTGSACNSGAQDPSYVLRAIGLSHDDAQGSLRVGVGRFNTVVEMNVAIKEISSAFERLTQKLLT